RGIIARKRPHGWAGVYHHWDSYPSGLGRMLYELYHGQFHNDVHAMMHYLIDEHPAGWSTIVDQDFALQPGYADATRSEQEQRRPQCYCHGDRHEKGMVLTDATTDTDCEFAYVIDEQFATMSIYRLRGHRWQLYREVDLNGTAPYWLFQE
ncbi:MAG: hypothetical protein M3Z24_15275, partial [Chloroflexota bacterium]|nr:hypothetical protein [Chloroflexota bacterium]